MRCYNGCPDKELQAIIDDSELAKRELEALGLRATWFPMEQGWVVFRGLHPINDDFYPSRRAAANAMRSRTWQDT